ncbi:MAG: hypothetical protein KC620_25175 [Myxococcales bacterium]|nr:hypothetical protein [Myxococcales bacterium]
MAQPLFARMFSRPTLRSLTCLIVLGGLLAACGEDDEETTVDAAAMADDAAVADMMPEEEADMMPEEEADMAPPAPEGVFAVFLSGALNGTPEEAGPVHDQIAAGGEMAAREAGDLSHDALISTELLGTMPGLFQGIDQWDDLDAMLAFYQNPQFAQGIGHLIMGMPTIEVVARRDDWHTWGDLTAADDAKPHYFVSARGHLAQPADMAQATHDMIAAGGQAAANMAGDVAHVVFLGVEDDRNFIAVDVWRDSANIEAFYGNPQFQAAFGQLFDGPPTVRVMQTVGWHEW